MSINLSRCLLGSNRNCKHQTSQGRDRNQREEPHTHTKAHVGHVENQVFLHVGGVVEMHGVRRERCLAKQAPLTCGENRVAEQNTRRGGGGNDHAEQATHARTCSRNIASATTMPMRNGPSASPGTTSIPMVYELQRCDAKPKAQSKHGVTRPAPVPNEEDATCVCAKQQLQPSKKRREFACLLFKITPT